MEKHLHIISFDIPYPANYGGAIDVYYKIKALHENGVKVILHCFKYNRKEVEELKLVCEKVYYYDRDTSLLSHLSYLPYTVYSRKNSRLINNLLKDNYPILFEGLMSSYYLSDKRLSGRIKLFREANIEHDYYNELAKATNSLRNRVYYILESKKMRSFEKTLNSTDIILAISQSDGNQLKARFPNKRVEFIPCFHPNSTVTSLPGKSNYILYHANLSVPENEIAVLYLCNEVFSKLKFQCIIAGLSPTHRVLNTVSAYENIQLIANPSENKMNELVQNAHINIIVTFQGTGLKIKLLNTLFSGRHIIVNQQMLEGSGLDKLCHISNTSTEQIMLCEKLMSMPFNQMDILERQKLLIPQYLGSYQAKKIMELLA
jgi:glycosyltransferase involved in cell wall biosynthesis